MDNGYVIHVIRTQMQSRPDKAYQRTLGSYKTYFDGAPTGLEGWFVERQGPGDNSANGRTLHRRIAAGKYPLATHAGANGKYRTIGYKTTGPANAIPRPCLGVMDTDHRDGILIHPAAGYCMSIGCLNATSALADGNADMQWQDSRQRVIAIIQDMAHHLGAGFPNANNQNIDLATLLIEGEP